MKTALLLICVVVPVVASAQFKVKNVGQYPMKVAIAFYEKTTEHEGWRSQGWYEVLPSQTVDLYNGRPLGNSIYYYAKGKGGEVAGTYKFVVSTIDNFNLFNADKAYVENKNIFWVWRGFKRADFPKLITSKSSVTVELK